MEWSFEGDLQEFDQLFHVERRIRTRLARVMCGALDLNRWLLDAGTLLDLKLGWSYGNWVLSSDVSRETSL